MLSYDLLLKVTLVTLVVITLWYVTRLESVVRGLRKECLALGKSVLNSNNVLETVRLEMRDQLRTFQAASQSGLHDAGLKSLLNDGMSHMRVDAAIVPNHLKTLPCLQDKTGLASKTPLASSDVQPTSYSPKPHDRHLSRGERELIHALQSGRS